jgi:hypothetical protein
MAVFLPFGLLGLEFSNKYRSESATNLTGTASLALAAFLDPANFFEVPSFVAGRVTFRGLGQANFLAFDRFFCFFFFSPEGEAEVVVSTDSL